MFETTIRYLGGLLSAYELSGKQYQPLLDKAKEVADKMAYAWVGVSYLCFATLIPSILNDNWQKNKIPYGHIDFSTNIPSTDTVNYVN